MVTDLFGFQNMCWNRLIFYMQVAVLASSQKLFKHSSMDHPIYVGNKVIKVAIKIWATKVRGSKVGINYIPSFMLLVVVIKVKNRVNFAKKLPYLTVFHEVSMSPKTEKVLCRSKFNLFHGTLQTRFKIYAL